MRIFDYAKVADWNDRLAVLADMAEPERWSFVSVPSDPEVPLPVLDSYMRYTFLRLHSQGKIAEVEEISCFNTGLLTPAQEEIFGVFAISENYDPTHPPGHDNKKWFLKQWARAGDRILTHFHALPGLATYWTDPAELIFDPTLEVRPNIDHILRENLNRFPAELGGKVDAHGVPQDLHEIPDIEDEASDPQVEEPETESAAPVSTEAGPNLIAARNALDGGIKHSIRLAERSYRVAVPQFYRGGIQLLLPLYLRDNLRADLALVLERHDDWYRAATVLYPDWGYRHARLLSRPNSEWLGGFRADTLP